LGKDALRASFLMGYSKLSKISSGGRVKTA